jgi:hypothetical protein
VKRSERYRKLARRFERGEQRYLCVVLGDSCADLLLFRPKRLPNHAWMGGWWGSVLNKRSMDCRILALCFMAAIAESEES